MKILFALLALLAPTAALADPISALAAIGTAVGAGASAAVVTGLMVTGSAISLVGVITGSKKLQRFGALVGLAGGIGAGYQALTAAAGSVAGESAATAALSQTPEAAAAGAAESFGVASSAGPVAARGLEEAVPEIIGSTMPTTAAMPESASASRGLVGPAPASSATVRNPVSEALSRASAHVGSFLKENKDLVKLSAGLIGGAFARSAEEDAQAGEWARKDQRRADYNAGIQGGSQIPFRVNTGVKVTQVPVQDPNRFIPQRGLIGSPTGGG